MNNLKKLNEFFGFEDKTNKAFHLFATFDRRFLSIDKGQMAGRQRTKVIEIARMISKPKHDILWLKCATVKWQSAGQFC